MTQTELIQLADKCYTLPDKVNFQDFNDIVALWRAVFTKEQLVELWELCKADFGIGSHAWDDEVYNALHAMGYFEEATI